MLCHCHVVVIHSIERTIARRIDVAMDRVAIETRNSTPRAHGAGECIEKWGPIFMQ